MLDLHPCAEKTVAAARENAAKLGVPLHVIKKHDLFKAEVILPFCAEYRAGRTPNPCVLCNPTIKFPLILDEADRLGIKYIATGHYAKITQTEANGRGRFLLCAADCRERDQSYMLYRLGQNVLSRLILPLQSMSKAEVREIAENARLPAAAAPDSQEICFIPDNDYAGYIEALCGTSPAGDFISPEGMPCGRHKGILHYTVGQRKGLGIALGRPVFITKIDSGENRIHLADSGSEYAEGVRLENCFLQAHPLLDSANWSGTVFSAEDTCDSTSAGIRCEVKIRSVAKPAEAYITITQPSKPQPPTADLIFEEPQRAPAPGQSVVWYTDDGTVLGGGIIA